MNPLDPRSGETRAVATAAAAGTSPAERGVSVALLAAVGLAGIALGAWLRPGPPAEVRRPTSSERPPVVATPGAARTPSPAPVVESTAAATPTPTPSGGMVAWPGAAAGRYTPVLGGGEGPRAGGAGDTLAAAPRSLSGAAPHAADAGAGRERPAERPPRSIKPPITAEGGADLIEDGVALTTPLLAVLREGGRVVLYDPRAGGSPGLPRDIEGGWAWLGDCQRFRIDAAQGAGSEAGDVRGIGRGSGSPRLGWAVPARGCARATRRLRVPQGGGLVDLHGRQWRVPGSGETVQAVPGRGGGAPLWSTEVPWPAVRIRILGAYRSSGGRAEELWIVAVDEEGAPRAMRRVLLADAATIRAEPWASVGSGSGER